MAISQLLSFASNDMVGLLVCIDVIDIHFLLNNSCISMEIHTVGILSDQTMLDLETSFKLLHS